MEIMIRKARVADVKEIHSLINNFTEQGQILPRSLSELYDHIRDYFVCSDDSDDNRVLGTCAMHICWDDVAEIRSLAVHQDYQGQGMGAKLVDACLSEAVTLGIYKIFVLTYKTGFFEKFGFKQIDKAILPHKIWADCLKCVRFPDCDEIAMLLTL